MFKPKEPTRLEIVIDKALRELDNWEVGSEEYNQRLDAAVQLVKIGREIEPNRISKEALLAAGVNLLGIILIIKHEQVNVITSKALGMVPKLRS